MEIQSLDVASAFSVIFGVCRSSMVSSLAGGQVRPSASNAALGQVIVTTAPVTGADWLRSVISAPDLSSSVLAINRRGRIAVSHTIKSIGAAVWRMGIRSVNRLIRP